MKLRIPTVADVREQRKRHLARSPLYRAGFALVGFLLILAGIPLLVLPGPAILFFAVGLGMLALEFTWAERALVYALDRAHKATNAVRQRRSRAAPTEGESSREEAV